MYQRPSRAHAASLPAAAQWRTDRPWTRMQGLVRSRDGQGDIDQALTRDPYPIPATADREGYHGERHFDYWLSGLKDYHLIMQRVQEVLEREGDPRADNGAGVGAGLTSGSRVLDFGCASGRVLRHFACQGNTLDVWGCDIAPSHVAWVRKHLHPAIKVFDNHALPSLPLEDNSFDLVYAFSVFSHLDEHELGWLLELRRILRPGGFAYLTTHTDHTWSILSPEHGVYQGLLTRMEGSDPPMDRSPEMFASPLPAERVVFWAKGATVYGKNVFQSTTYIRDVWGRFFEIAAIHREGAYYQDVIILRKPR